MYAATAAGRPLTFEVYGVWRKNMVIHDRETGTLWQHATGSAIDGPLNGAQLEVVPGWETTWGALKTLHPEARFAQEPERFTGLLPKPVLMRLLHITHVASLSGLSPLDQRLDAHELVIGVTCNGIAKAYPLAVIRNLGRIQDEVGEQKIHIQYHPFGDRVSIHTPEGQPLPCERQWWLGWSEFHPRSELYGGNQP